MMMSELRLFIYDDNGDPVLDPHGEIVDFEPPTFRTAWPGGFVDLRTSIARPVTRPWAVRAPLRLVLRSGLAIVFEGFVADLAETRRGGSESVALTALGYSARLRARQIHKRWCDTRLSEWRWPASPPASQEQFTLDHQNRLMFLAKDGISLAIGDRAAEGYTMPSGETIARITFNYDLQEATQAWLLGLYDTAGAAYLWSVTTSGTGSVDHTLASARQYLEFRFVALAAQTGLGDGTVYGKITDLCVYSETGNIYAGEIVQDILSDITEISVDYSDIGEPGLALEPFVTTGWKRCADVVARAAAFGDASAGTWGLCVWDSAQSSDGLPQASFTARDISDYEYQVRLADLEEFHSDPSLDELYNWIIVEYQDVAGRTAWLTPDDVGSLKDQQSIDEYQQRDYVLRVDSESATTAQYLGERFLARHKDPIYKTRFTLVDRIPDARGVLQPASRVRAGERVRVIDYLDGIVYFIAYTQYQAATGRLDISPDMPPDDVAIMLAQLQLK